MLERVPATAESAAHLLFRSFERPCRSSRVLDPKFWRHGTDDLDTPAWWPLYLQKVRQVPQTHQTRSEASVVNRWGARTNASGEDVRTRQRHTPAARPFTASAPPAQQAQAQRPAYDVFGVDDDADDRDERQEGGDQQTAENVRAPRRRSRQQQQEDSNLEADIARPLPSDLSQQSTSGSPSFDYTAPFASLVPPGDVEPKEAISQAQAIKTTVKQRGVKNVLREADHNRKIFDQLLQKKDDATHNDFDQAWRLFIAFDDQEGMASYMFRFLTRSALLSDLPRALEAFRLIPRHRRSEPQYRAAIALEQKRYQHHNAMNLAFEATIRGFNVLSDLLAHFVQNQLWNSVAELLYRNRTARRDMAAFDPDPQSVQGPNMLSNTELLKSCENVKDLHLKVLSLAQRLRSSNAELLEHKSLLDSFLKTLAVFYVQRPKLMGSAPTSGLLALFELQKTSGNLQLQEKALHVILHLPNRKEKADLALMTYRNLRTTLPQAPVPKWMLGGLIGICSDADYSLDIYNYLLDEFEDIYGKPDETAYQRVLTSCARQGNAAAVERVFAQYRSNYQTVRNLTWLSPLVYCYAVTGDAVNARKQFERIKKEFRLTPNQTCWNVLLLAYARSNDEISAFDVFDEMRKAEIRPSPHTYGTLLAICAAHGDTEAALELLASARDEGLQISVPMVNTVVESSLSNHDVEAAMRFAIATSESQTSESLTRLWNSFIRYFAAKGDTTALMNVRKLMSKYKVQADEMTYAAVMSALTLVHKTSEAVTMLKEMHHNQGLGATAFHYSIVLHGFVRERNRDMVTVIANEMRQRFPKMSPSANRALLLLQSQRDEHEKTRNSHSLGLVASILQDLYSTSSTSFSFDQSPGRPHKTSAVAALYFETVIESLIQNGSYEDASQLLTHMEHTMMEGELDNPTRSMKFLLARMDIAIARADHQTLRSIWNQLFDYASRNLKPIRTIREQRRSQKLELSGTNTAKTLPDVGSSAKSQIERETPILKAWRISLSKPLNRYMEAMAREDRLDEMIDFVKHKFRTAGFKLTGQNWNKYIQVLCRSSGANHHVHAFAMTEELMLNRAQSWDLLKRGLLRQKQTSYVFKAIGEHKRPVLQERSSYKVANRLDVMRIHPRRVIPTYTTMVHLSSALLHAERKAEDGSPGELKTVGRYAPGTKKFLQQMPHLKDNLQRVLLRNLERTSDPRKRPRSEQSIREKTDVSGILSGKSPLDHLPNGLLEDIKAIVRPSNDLRYILKGSVSSVPYLQSREQDIELGERLFGKIARESIVLAGKGRFETKTERTFRVAQQEKEIVKKVQAVREDLRQRQLTGEVFEPDLGLQKDEPLSADSSNAGSSVLATSNSPSLLPLPNIKGQKVTDTEVEPALQDTLKELPVRTQVTLLKELRRQANKFSSSSYHISEPQRALPYAERRRIGRLRALKQRREARLLLESLGRDNVSDRALAPRTAAGHRALLFEQAQRRRRAYLQYEAGVKAGKPLDPFPKTLRGYMERRYDQGPSKIRFSADLNRHPNRYLIRRGKLLEKRRPRVQPRDFNDRKFQVTTKRRRARTKKKDKRALRRAGKGLPPVGKITRQALAIGTRVGVEPKVKGVPYDPFY